MHILFYKVLNMLRSKFTFAITLLPQSISLYPTGDARPPPRTPLRRRQCQCYEDDQRVYLQRECIDLEYE